MPQLATYKLNLPFFFVFIIQIFGACPLHPYAVQEDFKQACLFIRDQKVDADDKLRLYGLFKCATVGVCNTTSPSIFQVSTLLLPLV